MTTTWCTAADVLTFAKTTVDDPTVALAGSMIDTACARPYDVFVTGVPAGQVCQISAIDLYWLKLACAYQAAWIPSQPDLFSRSDVTAVGRGKANVQLAPDALRYAPLATTVLKRVSFLKSRSMHVPGPMELDHPWTNSMEGDEGPGWRNLGPV